MQQIATLKGTLCAIQRSFGEANETAREIHQQVCKLQQQLDAVKATLLNGELGGWTVSECSFWVSADEGLYADLALRAPLEGTSCHMEMKFSGNPDEDGCLSLDLDDLDPDYLPAPRLCYADNPFGWEPTGSPSVKGRRGMAAIARYAPQLERAHEALRRSFPDKLFRKSGPEPFDSAALEGSRSTDYLASVTVREEGFWQLDAAAEVKPKLRGQVEPPSTDSARDLGARATQTVLPSHPNVKPTDLGSPEAANARLGRYYPRVDNLFWPFDSFITTDLEEGVAFLRDLVEEFDRLLGERGGASGGGK